MALPRPLAVAAAASASLTLVLAAPSTAFAADVTWDGDLGVGWDQPGNWVSGAVPNAGDALFFPVVGVDGYSENNLANPFVADRLDVSGAGVTISGWPIEINPAGTVGITVTAADVEISPELRLNGDQTVSVSASGAVDFPSNIRVESGTTTFDVDGWASIGQLDGVGFAGGVVKTGTGVLQVVGAGGVADGVQVQEGLVHIVGDGAGTAWVLEGGAISGNGSLERLLADEGWVAPGSGEYGEGIAQLEIWNQFTATENTTLALELAADGSSDSIVTLEGTQIDGAALDLLLEPDTTIGTEFVILEQEREEGPAFFWNFTTPEGDPIVEGEEFESLGNLYSLETVGRTVVVTYLGAAPVPPSPSPSPSTGPAPSALAKTGGGLPLGIVALAGGVILAGSLGLVAVRRARRSA
ncbi:hypothetical protein M2152_000286 [Microbacteriaceae bacterium SG_E_30_P1]|uniref:Uncharacterized protein n=1 Tax=Antiquaquibacter oligotrophicus TaxID=2880260 RepID=A0ABT6KJE5_9MICO|nr:hypothetical protein [Antiquaquibacter oligotrophicus]MDH6180104.1 hypothetical protein [Antiquaquibacter oligotrophicus]UDF14145.1 hypothetical protein LH407_04610 [Antiquaquibacter oligotrophicus]